MKRYLWLLLLISLGLNVGLGWRLVNQSRQTENEMRGDRRGRGDRQWRIGRGGDGSEDRFERPAPGDSVGWRRVMDGRLERMARRLNLDPEQVEVFRRAHHEKFDHLRGRRERIKELEERFIDLTNANPVNPDSIRAAVRELGSAKAALDSIVAEAILNEIDTLTPEQRREYLRLMPLGRSDKGRGPGFGRDGHRDSPPESPFPGE